MRIFNFFGVIYLPSALSSTMRGFSPRIFYLIRAINSITSYYISCSEAHEAITCGHHDFWALKLHADTRVNVGNFNMLNEQYNYEIKMK